MEIICHLEVTDWCWSWYYIQWCDVMWWGLEKLIGKPYLLQNLLKTKIGKPRKIGKPFIDLTKIGKLFVTKIGKLFVTKIGKPPLLQTLKTWTKSLQGCFPRHKCRHLHPQISLMPEKICICFCVRISVFTFWLVLCLASNLCFYFIPHVRKKNRLKLGLFQWYRIFQPQLTQ